MEKLTNLSQFDYMVMLSIWEHKSSPTYEEVAEVFAKRSGHNCTRKKLTSSLNRLVRKNYLTLVSAENPAEYIFTPLIDKKSYTELLRLIYLRYWYEGKLIGQGRSLYAKYGDFPDEIIHMPKWLKKWL